MPHYYWRYVDDFCVLLTTWEHLKAFQNFLNVRQANLFTIEKEKQNRTTLFDVYIIWEDKSFTTAFFCKPTFSGIYIYFEGFSPTYL